ncbi:MAG: GTP-binding protein HSR1 [Firmicutes bacterium]|nr:GTP-binding protein HSR1 [Bacillota bacterium]
MKQILVLGQTNAGKTLFTINFAIYLGASDISLTFQDSHRGSYTRTLELEAAKQLLVSDTPHYTRVVQSAVLELPWGKGIKKFEIVDTAGLMDGIHQDPQIRRAMSQTLAVVRQADIILHILDAAKIGKNNILKTIGEVDFQVAQFGQLKPGYVILANKIDLPEAMEGIEKIKAEFPGHQILEISALHTLGFKKVKEFVKRHL